MKLMAEPMTNPLQAVPASQVVRTLSQPVFAGEAHPCPQGPALRERMLDRMDAMLFALRARLTPVSRATFTVIDTETTGLDPHTSELLEVTAIQYRNGREIRKFSTLVKPSQPIPERIRQLTGITDAMVAEAPAPREALRRLLRFVGRQPLVVGHYVNFDLDFLQHRLEEAGLAPETRRFRLSKAVCTKTLGQVVLPELNLHRISGSLVALGEYLGIVNPNPHRAESDVQTTAGVLFALIDRSRQQGYPIRTVHDLLHAQGPPITQYDGLPRRPPQEPQAPKDRT